ncbi:hypothetical protein ABTM24_19855, partial [Acinetobacter baumannii]
DVSCFGEKNEETIGALCIINLPNHDYPYAIFDSLLISAMQVLSFFCKQPLVVTLARQIMLCNFRVFAYLYLRYDQTEELLCHIPPFAFKLM